MLPDAPSRNVVAEVGGREKPEEVVVLGGHIDSWDVGRVRWMTPAGRLRPGRRSACCNALASSPVAPCAWCSGPTRRTVAPVDAPTTMAIDRSSPGTSWPWSPTTARSTRRGTPSSARTPPRAWSKDIAALLDSVGISGVQRVPESPAADITPLVEEGVPGMELDVDDTRVLLVSPQRRRYARQARSG